MLCKVIIFAKSLVGTFYALSRFMQTFAGELQKKFKKILLSSCRIYTKRITFVSRKQVRERIIWFYLVRAEVVLWWHCLIFFAKKRILEDIGLLRIPQYSGVPVKPNTV
jgi:hypothetical protein